MRQSLLKSYLIVLTFWWSVSVVWFTASSPETTQDALVGISRIFPWVDVVVKNYLSILDSLGLQLQVIEVWVIPVALAGSAALGLGYLSAWLLSLLLLHKQYATAKSKESYRGMGITLGAMPKPTMLHRIPIKSKLSGKVAERFNKLTPHQKSLFTAGLEAIAAYPEAYAGAGHGVSLLQHTMNVVSKGASLSEPDPLLMPATVFHDIGKITAFKKIGDTFKAAKPHDKESARLLCQFAEWESLPENEREILHAAIKYYHSPWLLPPLEDEKAHDRTVALIEQLRHADGLATKEEKKIVIKKGDLPDMAVEAFLNILPSLPFQSYGHNRGIKAVGWKVGNRLYLIEAVVRDAAIKLFDDDTYAAIGGNVRQKNSVAEFTKYLLRGLEKRGWLVRKIGKAKVPVDTALWIIRSGTKEFKGIFIVDLPESEIYRVPGKDTSYEITVKSPLWESAGTMFVEDSPFMNALLK